MHVPYLLEGLCLYAAQFGLAHLAPASRVLAMAGASSSGSYW